MNTTEQALMKLRYGLLACTLALAPGAAAVAQDAAAGTSGAAPAASSAPRQQRNAGPGIGYERTVPVITSGPGPASDFRMGSPTFPATGRTPSPTTTTRLIRRAAFPVILTTGRRGPPARSVRRAASVIRWMDSCHTCRGPVPGRSSSRRASSTARSPSTSSRWRAALPPASPSPSTGTAMRSGNIPGTSCSCSIPVHGSFI